MSKYFDVLERLERGRSSANFIGRLAESIGGQERTEAARPLAGPRLARTATAQPAAVPDVVADEPEASAPARPAHGTVLELPTPLAKGETVGFPIGPTVLKGIEDLFHNVEALTKAQRPTTLVFAGASPVDPAESIAASLGQYAEHRGRQVLIAELREIEGRCTLVHRPLAGISGTGERPTFEIDVRGGATRETLTRCRERLAPGADFALVIGPSLTTSVVSALLASLADGLVLVAGNEQTHRAALTVAAERVRVTDSPVLGIVVSKGRDRVPGWFRRLVRL